MQELLFNSCLDEECVMNVDYHASSLWGANGKTEMVAISAKGSGRPMAYDYETASILIDGGGSDSDGHTFNVVLYQSKYRIMDYGVIRRGEYAFEEKLDNTSDSHKGDHVWNDQFGRYWFPDFEGMNIPSSLSCADLSNLNAMDLAETLGVSIAEKTGIIRVDRPATNRGPPCGPIRLGITMFVLDGCWNNASVCARGINAPTLNTRSSI